MYTSSHTTTCHCSLHLQIAARRHQSYRQLAQAILGPAAPQDDIELARALAEYSRLLQPELDITPIQHRPAA
jgi:hypothetical protein